MKRLAILTMGVALAVSAGSIRAQQSAPGLIECISNGPDTIPARRG